MPCFSSNQRPCGYAELIERCLDPLHRTAFRLTGNGAEAEDLVQETCIRAYRAWAQLREPAGAQAWLFRILRSAWLDRLRKKARRPQIVATDSEGVQPEPNALPLLDVTDAEGRRALEQAFDDEVLAAMNELPEDERLALMFQIFGGLSYREISEALDCPLGTVMSRLHRSKAALRSRLADYAARQRITIAQSRSTQREEEGHAQA
jgi:RNA polymerase sigma-70 factor (ECF subfamily)